MKVFDWSEALKTHRPEVIEWLREVHDKPLTLEEFMAGYRKFRVSDSRLHKSRRYQNASLKGRYKRLKENFGFFS